MGATGAAWRVVSGSSRLVLRLADPRPGKIVTFEAEAGFRDRLRLETACIARPVATHVTHPMLVPEEQRWSVDEELPGQHLEPADMSPEIWREIGALLACIHSQPASCFGRALNNRARLVGIEEDAVSGAATRFPKAWPFVERDIWAHPVVVALPGIGSVLEAVRPEILAYVLDSAAGPNHGDLHARQILVDKGKLTGLVDFGDLAVGAQFWDLASILYFNGSAALSASLEGYTADQMRRQEIHNLAMLFAGVIAVYHVDRAAILCLPNRKVFATRFLREWQDRVR